jgi:hypothetical protein
MWVIKRKSHPAGWLFFVDDIGLDTIIVLPLRTAASGAHSRCI